MRSRLVAAIVVCCCACGTAPLPEGFPEEPLQTVVSTSQRLAVAIRTSPQPPARGDQSVEYAITDAKTGRPMTGLRLAVTPWMPAGAHGASIVPTVSETLPGRYVASDVDLFMAGEWILRTKIAGPDGDATPDSDPLDDEVTPILQIP